jgi:hypothetical protein
MKITIKKLMSSLLVVIFDSSLILLSRFPLSVFSLSSLIPLSFFFVRAHFSRFSFCLFSIGAQHDEGKNYNLF